MLCGLREYLVLLSLLELTSLTIESFDRLENPRPVRRLLALPCQSMARRSFGHGPVSSMCEWLSRLKRSEDPAVDSKQSGSPATRVYPRTRILSFLTQAIAPPRHIFPYEMATLPVASLLPERPAY